MVRFSNHATVSGCDELVVGLTHARGGTLDLLMTDNIWLADNPVEVLNLYLLVGRYVPTKVIRVRNKDKPSIITNAGMHLAASRRRIFGGPVIALGLTVMSLFAVK